MTKATENEKCLPLTHPLYGMHFVAHHQSHTMFHRERERERKREREKKQI